jgi:hypothetical protein
MRWSGLSVVPPSCKLQVIIRAVGKPGGEIFARQPTPPAYLQHLFQVESIDGHRNSRSD